MRLLFISIGLLLITFADTQADGLFRWVDKDGQVHYGDRPATDAIGAEQKKFAVQPASADDELSYIVRKAKQDFPVTLYVSANCADYCDQGRSLLNKRGIPFVEKNIVTPEDLESYKKLTGGAKVPALTVGKTLLNGFEAGQWNSELDIAGYPKTAPYGSHPRPPAVPKTQVPAETEK